jgi:hypothetical protein
LGGGYHIDLRAISGRERAAIVSDASRDGKPAPGPYLPPSFPTMYEKDECGVRVRRLPMGVFGGTVQ